MTETRQSEWTAPPRRAGRSGRAVAIALGVLLLLPGLALMAGGGVVLWAHHLDRSDGFVTSPGERFSSPGHALVSDRVDLAVGADWLPLAAILGIARIEVTPDTTDEVFVGTAPAADANGLPGRRRADPRRRAGLRHAGGRRRRDSRRRVARSAHGPGLLDRTGLRRRPAAADLGAGRRRLGVRADECRRLRGCRRPRLNPALAGIGWAVLGAGLVVCLMAGLLLRPALRRDTEDRPAVRTVARSPYDHPLTTR